MSEIDDRLVTRRRRIERKVHDAYNRLIAKADI
jgi:hypothetical protein